MAKITLCCDFFADEDKGDLDRQDTPFIRIQYM